MEEDIIIRTFGCRMNTFESQCIKQMIKEIGFHNTIFINTCAITAEGERQVRQEIRKLHRKYPDFTIIVSGCSSQIHSSFFIKKMPEVEFIISNEFKLQKWVYQDIFNWIQNGKDQSRKKTLQTNLLTHNKDEIPENLSNKEDWEYIYNFEDRTRAFVPIQTGCNHYCSFCIVPFTRGKFKSFDSQHIIQQIQIFLQNGYNEIVLTGIDITDYGKDVRGKAQIDTLGKLCKAILSGTTLPRLRLSSVDVAEIDKDILNLIANEPRFMPYFHISLQSGSDGVLKRMRRRHTNEDVLNFCKRVLTLRPESAFGADIITGFPGETEDEFLQSLQIVKNAPISFVHAFPYSERERTLASLMNDDVPKKIKKERVNSLIKLGAENLQNIYKKMDMTTQNILIEHNNVAHAENFVKIETDDTFNNKIGEIVKTKVVYRNNKLITLT